MFSEKVLKFYNYLFTRIFRISDISIVTNLLNKYLLFYN